MTDLISGVNAAAQAAQTKAREKQPDATQAGIEFEQMFLAEMLKHAGLGKTSSFGGGIGEDQFQSFLVNEQARIMAQSGGIGIAKMVSANLEAKNGQ
ncbi:MAG: rod-binding protein [Deltaproteobacteria bacterium]